MAFDDIEQQRIKNLAGGFCKERTPAHIRDKLRYDYRIVNQDVILFSIRPHWREPNETIESEFAKMKYVRSRGQWVLYWMRANGKWERYEPYETSKSLEDILNIIDADAHYCFFG